LTERTNVASEYVPRILRVHAEDEAVSASLGESARASDRPLLSVVVPVYNGGDEIVDNVAVVRAAVTAHLDDRDIEIIVVSDGSIDGTAEALLAARADVGIRVIHYDRNLGKGYAVKLGSLASTGEWVAIVDADLDLHPSAIPSYLEAARRENLDFAVGSKRHPDSVVYYPRSRRMVSWMYQQLNRVLFRLDVRDTQVGLKVFRGEVADEVVPLLLVKRFAFDLELLAVGRALGFERMKEMPVRLDYRFTGSAVRSRAVVRALVDTLAIFYRLRILRTYQRKRALIGTRGRTLDRPLVTVLGEAPLIASLDYPSLERSAAVDRKEAARTAHGELLALVVPGASPASNWITACVPFLDDAGVAAVVAPTISPADAGFRERVASAALESRLGGGSRRSRFLPGNVGTVAEYGSDAIVVRRKDYLAALDADVRDEDLVAWLAGRGRATIYTPDTSVSAPPPPIMTPHLRATMHQARSRGSTARATRGSSLSVATGLSVLPLGAAGVAVALVAVGGTARTLGTIVLAAYGIALALTGAFAAFRLRSAAAGLLTPVVVVLTQCAYVVGFVRGLVDSRRASGSVAGDSRSARNVGV
jgi:glycosyltransferase involved in cell wall biosynthesis